MDYSNLFACETARRRLPNKIPSLTLPHPPFLIAVLLESATEASHTVRALLLKKRATDIEAAGRDAERVAGAAAQDLLRLHQAEAAVRERAAAAHERRRHSISARADAEARVEAARLLRLRSAGLTDGR